MALQCAGLHHAAVSSSRDITQGESSSDLSSLAAKDHWFLEAVTSLASLCGQEHGDTTVPYDISHVTHECSLCARRGV